MALLDSDAGRLLALTARAQVDAFAGREASARAAAEEALALARATDWVGAAAWQQTTLGALELSAGRGEAAAERLAPFAAQAVARGLPEPAADGVLVHGDAAEALILTGRVAEAEPLVALLEERGAALDRVWAIAVGARCRALIAAADSDLDGAEAALARALAAHARLPMPVEHGRTLLALGRVQRRGRRRADARASHTRALELFEAAGARLWAAQAREELDALGLRAAAPGCLTASEERVARLAAGRPDQSPGRRPAADQQEDGRGAPRARLPQARRPLARRAGRASPPVSCERRARTRATPPGEPCARDGGSGDRGDPAGRREAAAAQLLDHLDRRLAGAAAVGLEAEAAAVVQRHPHLQRRRCAASTRSRRSRRRRRARTARPSAGRAAGRRRSARSCSAAAPATCGPAP